MVGSQLLVTSPFERYFCRFEFRSQAGILYSDRFKGQRFFSFNDFRRNLFLLSPAEKFP